LLMLTFRVSFLCCSAQAGRSAWQYAATRGDKAVMDVMRPYRQQKFNKVETCALIHPNTNSWIFQDAPHALLEALQSNDLAAAEQLLAEGKHDVNFADP